jgi:ferrous iron transport protein B
LLRKKLGPDDNSPGHFLLELPPYRETAMELYLPPCTGTRVGPSSPKAGTIILGLSILLVGAQHLSEKGRRIDETEALAHSAMGRIGEVIEPIVKPLGFDGRIGTAILTSFAAREVFNSSLGVILYRVEETDDEEQTRSVKSATRSPQRNWPDGQTSFHARSRCFRILVFLHLRAPMPADERPWSPANPDPGNGHVGQFVFMSAFAWAGIVHRLPIRQHSSDSEIMNWQTVTAIRHRHHHPR